MHGKVVLITGGAKRVGAAIARLLHAAGANLMIHYRSSALEARALQDELNAVRADSVALIQADLLDVAVLPSLVSQTVTIFGGLDVLVPCLCPCRNFRWVISSRRLQCPPRVRLHSSTRHVTRVDSGVIQQPCGDRS